MSCSQETEEVPTKGLDGTFRGVGAFLVGGYWLVGDVLVVEVGTQGLRGFVTLSSRHLLIHQLHIAQCSSWLCAINGSPNSL